MYFSLFDTAPSGPPLGVVIYSKSKSSLSISWKPPNITFWNGIVNMYKVCHSITGDQNVKCSGAVTSSLSYTIRNLQSATKYSVKVSAGTSAGYGTVFSAPVIDITNQGESFNRFFASEIYLIVKTLFNIVYLFCLSRTHYAYQEYLFQLELKFE